MLIPRSSTVSNPILQVLVTIAILFTTIFVFGFVADPIINLYLDPYDTIVSIPSGGPAPIHFEDDEASWAEHFLKGLASLGLLGFVKVFFAMSPWHWWNLRQSGMLGGGRGRGNTGRDRLENISWSLVLIGLVTFLYVSRLLQESVAEVWYECRLKPQSFKQSEPFGIFFLAETEEFTDVH